MPNPFQNPLNAPSGYNSNEPPKSFHGVFQPTNPSQGNQILQPPSGYSEIPHVATSSVSSSSYQSKAVIENGKITGGYTPAIEGVSPVQTVGSGSLLATANKVSGIITSGGAVTSGGYRSMATSGFVGLAQPSEPVAQAETKIVAPPTTSTYQISGSAPRELKEQQIMSDLIRGGYVKLEQQEVSPRKFAGYERYVNPQGTTVDRAVYTGGEVSTKLTPMLPAKTLDEVVRAKLGDTSASYKEVSSKFITGTQEQKTETKPTSEFKYDAGTMASRYTGKPNVSQETKVSDIFSRPYTPTEIKEAEVPISTKPLMSALGLPQGLMPAGATLTNKQLQYSITGTPTTSVTPIEGGYQTITTTPIETTTIKFTEPVSGKGFVGAVASGYRAREQKAIEEASISMLPFAVGYGAAVGKATEYKPITEVVSPKSYLPEAISKHLPEQVTTSQAYEMAKPKGLAPIITPSGLEKSYIAGAEVSRKVASSVGVTEKANVQFVSGFAGKGKTSEVVGKVMAHGEMALATGLDVMGVSGAYRVVGGGAVALGKQVLPKVAAGEFGEAGKAFITGVKGAADIVGSPSRLVTGFIPETYKGTTILPEATKAAIQTGVGKIGLASLAIPSEVPVVGEYAKGGRQAVKEYVQYLTFTGSPSDRTGWIVATSAGNIPYSVERAIGGGAVLAGGKLGMKGAKIAEIAYKGTNVLAGGIMAQQALEATSTVSVGKVGQFKEYHPVSALGYFQWQFATQEALHEPLSYDVMSEKVFKGFEETIGKRAVSKAIPVTERKWITSEYSQYWSKIAPEFKTRIGVTPVATGSITPTPTTSKIVTPTVVKGKVTTTQVTEKYTIKDITAPTTKVPTIKIPTVTTYRITPDITITPTTTKLTDTTVSRDITSTMKQDTTTYKQDTTTKVPTIDIGNWGQNLPIPPFAMFPDSGAKAGAAAGTKGSIRGSIMSMLDVTKQIAKGRGL